MGWYLFGAQAALLYGAVRLTADVDVTVQLERASVESMVAALESSGFDLRIQDPEFVRTTRVLPIVHRRTGIPVDVVLGGPGLEELFLSRSVVREVGGVRVPVARVEDLIVMKVLAGRPKDDDDVIAMLRAQAAVLDLEEVRSTLALVEEAIGQSDMRPSFEQLVARSIARGTRR